MGERFLFLSYI